MKKMLLASAAILFSATAAFAAPHTYQVTGEVLEITDSKIVISKGKDNWELARDKQTKLPDSVKVGSKITVEYSMAALDITDKSGSKKGSKGNKVSSATTPVTPAVAAAVPAAPAASATRAPAALAPSAGTPAPAAAPASVVPSAAVPTPATH